MSAPSSPIQSVQFIDLDDSEDCSNVEIFPQASPTVQHSPFKLLAQQFADLDATEILPQLQSLAAEEGSAVRKTQGTLNNFAVICTRAGEHQNTHQYEDAAGRMRKKNSEGYTKKCGCTWRLYVARKPKTDSLWRISIKNLQHNHELSSSYAFHQHRKLTEIERALAIAALKAKAPPRSIVEMLHKKSSEEGRKCYIEVQEIYNLRAEIKSAALSGRTPTDAIIRELIRRGIPHLYDLHPLTDELQTLFFCNPMGIILAKHYGYVLFMDATYKVNRYGMPLLHIVGTTPSNLSFTVALCFLTGETEEEYFWTMNALKEIAGDLPNGVVLTDQCTALRNALSRVFPLWKQQLCRWHLAQNLVKNFKARLSEDDFDSVNAAYKSLVNASTKTTFDDLFRTFRLQFLANERTSACWLYIERQMLLGKYFLAHELSHTLNFGETATLRIESFHRAIKSTIGGAGQDLFGAVNAALDHMRSIHRSIFLKHSTDAITNVKCFPPSMYDLRGRISLKGQWKIFEGGYRLHQAARLKNEPLRPCTHSMKKSMGLVCQHDFERILAPDESYPLIIPSSIHRFWHLKQQHELEAEAKNLALKYVRNNATVGTFFTHYPLDKLPAVLPQADHSTLMPMNEYLDPGEIIREMSPDALIIQEPISCPQFVKAQAKKKRKRGIQDIKQGLGSVEDEVRPHAKSGRMSTAGELATQEAERRKAATAELKKKSEGKKPRKCGSCGHRERPPRGVPLDRLTGRRNGAR